MKIEIYFRLVIQDIKERYLGSLLGVFWAFFNPIINIIIIVFVFTYGFKRGEVDGFPYSVWFISGFIPWFYFSESFSQSANSIIQKAYLIKKVKFNPWYLPSIKIISNLFIFFILLFMYILILKIYNLKFSIYNLQIIYYVFSLIIFLHVMGYLFSVFIVFIKDFKEIISLILRFGFWITPVFWSIDTLPLKYKKILEYNPLVYIVEGFRNSFLYHKWFWNDKSTLYFWSITLILGVIAVYIFYKSKDHFADVL